MLAKDIREIFEEFGPKPTLTKPASHKSKGKFEIMVLTCMDEVIQQSPEIKSLENKIEMLQTQKAKLGFNTHHNSGFTKTYDCGTEIVDSRTKAGRFFYLKMARNIDVQNLKDQKNSRLKQIWLTNQRLEVVRIVNAKPDIKMLEKPKTK
ncbi:MAG: hypothetical protein IIB44_05285 [Candidatus Marinimicrobia bacterium]|nr:hypothetical protein [Candidatus Neomarinimicrobiota bacterium]